MYSTYNMHLSDLMYRDLRRECIADFEKSSKLYYDYAEDGEDLEEIKDLRNCVCNFLDNYAKLSAGAMDDFEINKFYKHTINLLKQGIQTRKYQYEQVIEELDDIIDQLNVERAEVCDVNSPTYDSIRCEQIEEKIDEARASMRLAKKYMMEDDSQLAETLQVCQTAKDCKDRVLCIDRVANMVHGRGSYLPVMCGVPLAEFIVGIYYDSSSVDNTDLPAHVVAVDLSKDITSVLECIKNFGTNQKI